MPIDYAHTLAALKERITSAQGRAAVAVNRELVTLYFEIGKTLIERQAAAEWGDSVIERLSDDLRAAFPKVQGFSARNLWRMCAFVRAWTGPEILPPAVAESSEALPASVLPPLVAETPWAHNVVLLERLTTNDDRLWYAQATRDNAWSRRALETEIARKAHTRQGKATTNFTQVLEGGRASLAQETLKDPYLFDFLTTSEAAQERVIERELLAHVRSFLLELGAGFAFLGNQVKLTVGGEDYYLDLLFYHVKLHCYVVIELKATDFQPEHAGKLNFYLSAVDDLLKSPDDHPSIGLLLCKSRNKVTVEYALRDLKKPMGVAQWERVLVDSLPAGWVGSLPTVEEIEAELGDGTAGDP